MRHQRYILQRYSITILNKCVLRMNKEKENNSIISNDTNFFDNTHCENTCDVCLDSIDKIFALVKAVDDAFI